MYNILVRAHSGFRWIVLLLLILAIVKAFQGMKSQDYKEGDRKVFLFAMIVFHLQFVIGLVLYFMTPKFNFSNLMDGAINRFYGVEHLFGMLVGFVLITMGHSKSKKIQEVRLKYKRIGVFYTIALLIVLASIPWPFRALGAGWF